MRLLVTGGAGFIGSTFVKRIIDGTLDGISEIIILDKLTYAGTLSNLASLPQDCFEFVLGDICDPELTKRLAKRSDAIINFAAESHVDRSISSAKDFVLTNVLGTQTLLDAAKATKVETFVQISTDEVYGTISEGSWSETAPLLPNSPYAASKASADLLARSYYRTFGLDVRVTRCSNNYGPNQFPEKVIPLFITNLIDDLKVPVYGNGSNAREWLHVDDHCRGIHAVLIGGAAGEIYNIGGGTELSNLHLTQKILALVEKDTSSIEYVPDRLGHDLRYSIDISKISQKLSYISIVDIERGLRETVEWYRQNATWWRPLKNK